VVRATVEDYTKTIYSLEHASETGAATTNSIAARLGVSAPAVSAMVKKLGKLGLVEHVPYRGVRLTDEGTRTALEVLRHHRLLETYLVEELGVPWESVHDEAEVLEHVLSQGLEELIAAKLGEPTRDPHGDPIPTRDGAVDERPTVALAAVPAGRRATFVRVSDRDPALLRRLGELGLRPGDSLRVVEVRDDSVTVAAAGGRSGLDVASARAIRVEVDG
jgi:DtxR family Mn-dependent transcriptional regulator